MLSLHPGWLPQIRLHWRNWLGGLNRSRYYPFAVALLALPSAGTGLYPFAPILIAALLIAPLRWRSTYLAASLGATLGASLLAVLIASQGLSVVHWLLPGIEQHRQWLQYSLWVARYGPLALFFFAALPMPQTPVLIITALGNASVWQIALAVFAGKLVKYGVYVAMTLGTSRMLKYQRAQWRSRRQPP